MRLAQEELTQQTMGLTLQDLTRQKMEITLQELTQEIVELTQQKYPCQESQLIGKPIAITCATKLIITINAVEVLGDS